MMWVDRDDATAFCCEINETEELSEFSSRLRTFEPGHICFVSILFELNKENLFKHSDLLIGRSIARTFSPHSLHVPMYLDKCCFLI